jgi:hypothetical protein
MSGSERRPPETQSSIASSAGFSDPDLDLANSRMMLGQGDWTYETLVHTLSQNVFSELHPNSAFEKHNGNYVEYFSQLYVSFLNKHWPRWKLEEHGAFSSVGQDQMSGLENASAYLS